MRYDIYIYDIRRQERRYCNLRDEALDRNLENGKLALKGAMGLT
jgi:hypothetical protein